MNSDDGIGEASCPICANTFEREDIKYPLLDDTEQCHFNMCLNCVNNLIDASEKTQEASDGNEYKLNVQCPSCRGKFCVLLEDVILLREVEREGHLFQELNDSELSAADLRRKYDGERISSIKAARERYADATNESIVEIHGGGKTISNSVDLRSRESCDEGNQQNEKKIAFIDSMLFCGLAETMTKSEQIYVKQLMVSGSTTKLIQASHILESVTEMNHNGGTPSMRQKMKARNNQSEPKMRRIQMQKSQSHVVGGSNSKYQSYEEKLKVRRTRSSNATPSTVTMSLSSQTPTELQIETINRERWRRLFPIPVRMPKAITLKVDFDLYSRWRCPITFVDDEVSFVSLMKHAFNGAAPSNDVRCSLVRDAYRELKITGNGNIANKETPNSTGVENILSYFHDFNDNDAVDAPTLSIPWRRVVVSSVKGSLLRTGIKPGDVITHIDGEFFDGNTEKLKRILSTRQQRSLDVFPTFQVIVNAEVGVAEALRIRSIVAERQHDEPLF